MIDVGVGPAETPQRGVGGEVSAHVLVHALLQVDLLTSIGANHHIRTDAPIGRYVAARIVDTPVAAVVDHRVQGLRARCLDECAGLERRQGWVGT